MISNPTPQRATRAPAPKRPTARVAASGEHLAALAGQVTTRDRWLLRTVHEHRVLTTTQIADLAFPSPHAARDRLNQLYQRRLLERFRPQATRGTAPLHYVLDTAGAALLAHEDGIDPDTSGYRHQHAVGIAYSLQLAHTVAVNTLFTRLIAHARATGSGRLLAWWPESRCHHYFGDLARPDAYGRWREADDEIEFFLEHDWGTENLSRLARKIDDYHRLATTTGITTPVLFVLPSPQREAHARTALRSAVNDLPTPELVPVATAVVPDATSGNPAAELWLPLTGPSQRSRLSHLARAWPLPRAFPDHPAVTAPTTPPPRRGLQPPAPMPPWVTQP